MHDGLEPVHDPASILCHEGYKAESAVESRFAFGSGILGMRAAPIHHLLPASRRL